MSLIFVLLSGLSLWSLSNGIENKKLPLICPPGHQIARLKVNHDYNCSNFTSEGVDHESSNVTVIIWNKNRFLHDGIAYQCKVIVHTIQKRCWGWFSEKEEVNEFVGTEPIYAEECRSINKSKIHREGGLLRETQPGFWSTEERIPKVESSCLFFNTWYSATWKVYYLSKVKLEVDSSGHMFSSGGSMSTCPNYIEGSCYKNDNSSIVWIVSNKPTDQYIAVDHKIARRTKGMYLTIDNTMAFSEDKKVGKQNWDYCYGLGEFEKCLSKEDQINIPNSQLIISTHQGLFFSIIREERTVASDSGGPYKVFKTIGDMFGRKKRDTSFGPSDISSALQALALRMETDTNSNMITIARTVCMMMEANSRFVMAASSTKDGAINLARKTTSSDNVYGRVSGDYLTVSNCRVVDKYKFLKMNRSCSSNIPIVYKIKSDFDETSTSDDSFKEYFGYMDPMTRVISPIKEMTSCDEATEILVELDKPYIYNGQTGALSSYKVKETKLYTEMNSVEAVKTLIVPEVHTIEVSSKNPMQHLEDYFEATEKMAKVFEKSGGERLHNTVAEFDPRKAASNLLYSGFISSLMPSFEENPVFRLCLLLTVLYQVYSFIFYFVMPWAFKVWLMRNVNLSRIFQREAIMPIAPPFIQSHETSLIEETPFLKTARD